VYFAPQGRITTDNRKMAEEDNWEENSGEADGELQDKWNKFDAKVSIGGPPSGTDADVRPSYTPTTSAPLKPLKSAGGPPPTGKKDDVSEARTYSMRKAEPSPTLNAFTAKLDAASLAFFNEVASKPFSEQACSFLNAYWSEVGSQAEFIFTVAWEMIKYADMHANGIMYIHLYDEGKDLDFNIGLYFYEKLCKLVLEDDAGKKWRDDKKYAPSMPSMLTALVRKQELREKVDVNFDGRISFLEYLLYQYREFANPADFTTRAMAVSSSNPEMERAKALLEEVNKAIRAYEQEKQRLEKESKQDGVKGLGAKHQLSVLNASPLAEHLNTALIKAEAAVRMCGRKYGGGGSVFSMDPAERAKRPTDGSMWWLSRDLASKKERYGKK